MSTIVNKGWIKDSNGDKFAPKTLLSQVVDRDGELLETYIDSAVYADVEDNVNVDYVEEDNITIDDALSETSVNPVQNKIVTEKFNQLSQEIEDIGTIKTVTGTSATVTDAIDGKVISCIGNGAVTVSGYNICPIKELSYIGYGSDVFGTKLPAGTYTLTAECNTNNPNVTNVKVSIGGFIKSLQCDGKRNYATFSITREIDAYIKVWASDQTSAITEYSVSLSNIVITADSTAKEYEPYFEPITYNEDKLDEIELTEYTNIITSDSDFTLKYVHKNAYVKSLLSSIDVETKTYVTPEEFGAYGNGVADDTQAVNECIKYAIEYGIPIRGYGKYKTTDSINIIGNYVDLHIYKIDYLGDGNAVVYQGSNSFVTIQSIKSKGNGLCIIAETTRVYYNTFTINEIVSDKNGVYIYAKDNNYQNKLNFNHIKSKGDYSCVLLEKDKETDTGYLNEWQINGGLVTGGLWGVRGHLETSDSIFIHAEGLGSVGKGGAIYSESGMVPRIYYCRNAEVVQINTFLKLSGVFFKPQISEICKAFAPLNTIDITELELDVEKELESDNIQTMTGIEIQKEAYSNILLTKNLILWGNRFQLPPVRYIRLDVNSNIDMTPQYYNESMPQCFVTKTNATINLHPTYAANCLSTFEIVQEEEHKLTVKDFVGNIIFDGTQYTDGRYRLTAYITDDVPLKYDMSNQMWEIVKLY